MSKKGRTILLLPAVVLALLGLVLLFLGGYLIIRHGSWYYLLCGVAFLLTAWLLAIRLAEALWLFATVVLATVIWALIEVGFDWWPIAARGGVLFVFGVYLLMPWNLRALSLERPSGVGMGAALLGGSLALAAVVGGIALFTDMHDTSGVLSPRMAKTTLPMAGADWTAYGGTWAGDRYSTLEQISPANVQHLKRVWTFETGDEKRPGDPSETTYEVTSLKIGDTVYLCTPHDLVIALNAETGKLRWKYDPHISVTPNLQHLTCRGVSYYQAGTGLCARRIYLPTADARLIALDAANGRLCAGFGRKGIVDLWQGMPQRQTGFYYSTAPPVVMQGVVVIGGEVTDDYSTREPSGVVRGYDAVDGHLIWNWDSGSPDNTAPIGPGQHYTRNSPNMWNVAAADEKLGLVYLPMGNQTPDTWGANRSPAVERFSSSITALEIRTGKVRWVFQTVHHDLWDMDIGAQPSLIDLSTSSGLRSAIMVPTKRGDIYVLDRRTGQSILPLSERPVPQGPAPGDHLSPTQPFTTLTLMPEKPLRETDMWGMTMFDQLVCRIQFRRLRYDGIFTPPSLQGSLVYPGNFGVIDWGGIAVDPQHQIAFANPDYFAFVSRLLPRERLSEEGLFLHESKSPQSARSEEASGSNPQYGTPFAVNLHPFLSVVGLPCQAPPWGYVAGLDLAGAKVVWMHKNGTIRDESPIPLPFKMGVPSLGGPIMTAGGVAFLNSTLDYYIRAYDVRSGRELWSARLPAGAQATPITYWSAASGRQFVVVVAGGHGTLGTKLGDYVIAYALPKS